MVHVANSLTLPSTRAVSCRLTWEMTQQAIYKRARRISEKTRRFKTTEEINFWKRKPTLRNIKTKAKIVCVSFYGGFPFSSVEQSACSRARKIHTDDSIFLWPYIYIYIWHPLFPVKLVRWCVRGDANSFLHIVILHLRFIRYPLFHRTLHPWWQEQNHLRPT